MNHVSFVGENARARCLREFKGENEGRLASLPIDSYLLLYLAVHYDVM